MSADSGGRLSRRGFLLGAGAAGTAGLAGVALGLRPWETQASTSGASSGSGSGPGPGPAGPLVLVTLYGGNDGVNTVIPYADPAYRSARPNLGYAPSEVLSLDDGLGLNPKLPGLHTLWQAGQLAIVRGVGYPNPNLSHFASMAIWQTANPVDGSGPGWLGKWLDSTGDGPMRAISVGATLPPVLRGSKESATALVAPTITLPGDAAFQEAYAALQGAGSDRAGLAGLVAGAGRDLLDVKGRLDGLGAGSAGSGGSSPGGSSPGGSSPGGSSSGGSSRADLSGQLGLVAGLIRAGAPTQVYQVSLSSFDTHAGEKADQERLLAELDAGVTGFLAAVRGTPHGERVVVMTYSEFGRRPVENASGGTDHGTAAPLFVMGPTVHGGKFYADEPSLTALDANGNLKYTADFRSVYATVLERVIGVDAAPILGQDYPVIDLV
jgi:uncharacterized protein (DUF1501 family)